MSDLISRQGALAKIRTRLQDWAAYGNEEYRRGLYACEDMIISLPSASQNLAEPNKTMKGSDLISRADAIDAVWKIVPVETEIDSTLLDKAEVIVELSVLPSAEAVQGWIPVSDIRKLEGILLMKINSFEGTRNIVENGMLEVWKEVVEYIDGMLGEDGEA